MWGLVLYSTPSTFHHDVLNDHVILDLCIRVTDMVIGTSVKVPFTQTQTPRRFCSVAQKCVMLTQIKRVGVGVRYCLITTTTRKLSLTMNEKQVKKTSPLPLVLRMQK